jgi:hypothetical protein
MATRAAARRMTTPVAARQIATPVAARQMATRAAIQTAMATRAVMVVVHKVVALLEVQAPEILVILATLVTLAIRTILPVLVISPRGQIQEARIQGTVVVLVVRLPMAILTLEAQVQAITMVPELHQEGHRTAVRKTATLVEVQGAVALLETVVLLAIVALQDPRMMARRMATLAELQEAVDLLTTWALDLLGARNLMLEVNQVAMSLFLCLSLLPLVPPKRPSTPDLQL